MAEAPIANPPRPEIDLPQAPWAEAIEVRLPVSFWRMLSSVTALRRALIVLALVAVWQVYGQWLDDPLMFPAFSDVFHALVAGFASGVLVERTLATLRTLLIAYAIGLGLAGVLTSLAITTRFGSDLLGTLTAMFNPLPAIALLPLALLWFGLGPTSLVFVIVQSVLWSVALSTHTGFATVSDTLRMVGRNCGLRGIGFVAAILVPAAFPAILAGMKIGWAFAWRTAIAAELVFGVSSGSGGLGWYIYESRENLDTANVFAGLVTIIVIGLFVEGVVFRFVEAHTVTKWGMQRA
jgi:NitT/TauT family transport system permease protein